MHTKLFKYVVVLVVLAGLVGGCTWAVSRWLMMNETVPETALKVLGAVRGV